MRRAKSGRRREMKEGKSEGEQGVWQKGGERRELERGGERWKEGRAGEREVVKGWLAAPLGG